MRQKHKFLIALCLFAAALFCIFGAGAEDICCENVQAQETAVEAMATPEPFLSLDTPIPDPTEAPSIIMTPEPETTPAPTAEPTLEATEEPTIEPTIAPTETPWAHTAHIWEVLSNAESHWKRCVVCGAETDPEAHYSLCVGVRTDVCTVCGQVLPKDAEIRHEFNFDLSPASYDAQGHWWICARCGISSRFNHEYDDLGICQYCGALKPAAVKPKKVLLPASTLTMNIGDTLQLSATLQPDGAVSSLKWSSSTKKVAIVDSDGVVTAMKAGSTTIQVKTENGKKAKLKLRVVDPKTPTGISFDRSTLWIGVGETRELTVQIAPDTAVTSLKWSSSSKKIVSVDANGRITGNKIGKATITAKTANGKKAKLTVRVAASIPPESVSISFPQTVLQLGESYRLNAVLNPSTAITNFTWTSSNPSVLRVSDGTMTAIGTGTARIEVRTENGCVSQKSFAVIDANAPEEVAYARALSLLEAGENPMDEPVLVDLLRNALIQDNVPETQVSTLLAALLTAPETYRNIYLESFFEYSRNGSANVTTGISFYSLTRNTLFMSRTEAISQYMYTFFHESAHAADYNAAVGEERRYWSQLQVTLDALKADVASYLREQAFAIGLEDNLAIRLITRLLTPFADVSQEKLTASEEDAFQQLIYVCQDALWILPRRNSMMVQDMIGAMTNNAIDTGYGHYSSTSSYWFDEDTGLPTGMQAAEAWAEFFSAQITSDSAAISANEGILPRTCRVFAEVVAPAIETIFRSAILKLASAF